MDKMSIETRRRVEEELFQLTGRIGKLETFLASITEEGQEVDDLREQWKAMKSYEEILQRRLKADEAKSTPLSEKDQLILTREKLQKIYNEVDEAWYHASMDARGNREKKEMSDRLSDWKNRLYKLYTGDLA